MQTKEYINNRRQRRREASVCIYCAVPVKGRVTCKECADKSYARAKRRGDAKKFFYKHRERLNKKNLERYFKRKYSGNYHIVMERDGHCCKHCGNSFNLTVHHIDHSGQTKNPNNNLENLIVLCSSCHGYYHRSLQRFEVFKGKTITCSECQKTKKLWSKKNWCCRLCYTKNHMYLTSPKILKR